MTNVISEAPRNLAMQFASDSVDRLNARCNMRVGIWAGAKLGLPEESRAVYALEVMVAGMIDPGHDDVVDKIMHDFTRHGIPMTRRQILVQLSKDHHYAAAAPRDADDLRLALNIAQGACHEVLKS